METKRPTKEQVREFTERRKTERTPPPSPEQIRRELGWGMIPGNDENKTPGWDTPRTV